MTLSTEFNTSVGCSIQPRESHSIPASVQQRVFNHPCYAEGAHHHFARMHVAVAPACNIQCHYCNRKYDCANESRPGVVSELLTPEQAVKKVLMVSKAIPQLTVLGIAGPGDPLANPERTLTTLRMLSEQFPKLKLCLSTNGLVLPEYVETLITYHVEHITITINCLDPAIGAEIYPWIFWKHRRLRGQKAAAVLIEQQLIGLDMLVSRDILVKVNSVLIPGINDHHLEEVSKVIKAKGAFLHNIMPLISEPEHGTYYGLMGQRGPSETELRTLQDKCAVDMRMMRHCRQCRADAVGYLDKDLSHQFSLDKIEETDVPARSQHRETLSCVSPREATLQFVPIKKFKDTYRPSPSCTRIAVTTKGHGLINEHFGHAKEFLIYEVSPNSIRFIETREATPYCAGSEFCDQEAETSKKLIQFFSDCRAILCARIGLGPRKILEAAGISVNSDHAMVPIKQAITDVYQSLSQTELPLS